MTTIQLRRGTTKQWADANPVLAQGEPGYDTVTGVLKVGDGTSQWAALPVYPAQIWTPRQFGSTGMPDDTPTFQSAVDYLTSHGGGTLWCDEPQYKIGNLLMKSNVVLRSLSRKTTLSPPLGFSDQWIIDTPPKPDKQFNIGICDLLINGGVTSAGSPDVGGIQFQNTAACQLSNVGIAQTSLGAFKQLAGQATRLVGCGFQNHYEYRTLNMNEGALWLSGTDHIVIGCECNGGATRAGGSDGYNEVQYPDDLYRCAMLLAGSTIWVYGSNGEYADVGIKVTGSENRLIGARGDVNAGPGIVVEGIYNSLTNTLVLANSLGDDGNYSHIQLGGGAYGTVLEGVTEGLNFVDDPAVRIPRQVKYVVDDQVDVFGDPTRSDSLPTIRNVVDERQYKYRKINQKYVSRATAPTSAGNPVARPPSRYCAGGTYFDTKATRLTISDGSSWRDAGGALVGNVLPPKIALLNDPDSLGWDVLPGGGTSNVAGVRGWANFNRARALEITAAGGSDTCGAQMTTPVGNVVAGTGYALIAYHVGVSQIASLSFTVTWYDDHGTTIGTPVTTPGYPQTTANTAQKYPPPGPPLVPVLVQAPAGAKAVALAAVFTRTGMQANEVYQVSKICLVPGNDPGNFIDP